MNINTIPQDFSIVLFKDAFDNVVQDESTLTWPELVELFSKHNVTQDKDGVSYIMSSFKTLEEGAENVFKNEVAIPGTVARKAVNVRHVSALILDYDGGATIKEVKEQLSGIKHLGYTSFNHLKDGKTHKFRVIVPLLTPCPAEDWVPRRNTLKEMFEGVDKSTFSLSRIFFTPRHNGKIAAETWNTDGDLFDWTQVPAAIEHSPVHQHAPTEFSDDFKGIVLSKVAEYGWDTYEEWQDLCGMMIGAGYSESDFLSVCRSDAKSQRESRTLWKNFSKSPSRKTMGSLIYKLKEIFPGWYPPADPTADVETLVLVRGEKKVKEPNEEITFDDLPKPPKARTFRKCTPSEQRKTIVREFVQKFLRSFSSHGVLRTPEGYGKSTEIVAELIKSGQDVMFCCLSNKQAAEKMNDFSHYNPTRVYSTGALIERDFGIKPVMNKAKRAWGIPELDEQATVEAMMTSPLNPTEEDCFAAIDEYKVMAQESRNNRSQLSITTFATGDVVFNKDFGKTGLVFVVDDPSRSDLFTHKYRVAGEDSTYPILEAERKVEEVMFGKDYFMHDKIIWTTTEEITSAMIVAQHPSALMVDVKEALDTNGRVLILGSKLVWSTTKICLPGIHKAIASETDSEQLFIANGVKEEFNLVSSKGRNDLMKDTTIVISRPHPCELESVMATLGREPEDKEIITRQMVTDDCDQAVGRSQAYRNANNTYVLIIADPGLVDSLIKLSRYQLNTPEGMKRRGRLNGVPLVWAVHQPEWWSLWAYYLSTWQDNIKVIGKQVFETLSMQRLSMTERVFKALEHILKEPTKHIQHKWKPVTEFVEGEDSTSRRNYSMKLNMLVSDTNVNKVAATKVGKRKYVNELGQNRMFEPGKVPAGWSVVKKKKRTR